jgi:endonuclease/exonuclease/phosphatase family metal-dependent hydrolase
MRVATWNLWWRYGPWRQRRDAIAATLAEIDADLIGLQEVWGDGEENFAAELAERLGRHWCWAVAAAGSDGLSIGNAVLSRWPISAQAQTPLPTEDANEGRAAVHARVETPGGPLPMFSTHLTYGPGLSRIRVAQVRRLAEFVAEHSADTPYPPVVTGDLNSLPESDEIRRLEGFVTEPAVPGLVLLDAWRAVGPGEPGYSWARRNGYQADNPLPDCRIDYVLAGLPRAGRGRVVSARLAGTEPVNGVWPSDHFAVVAEFEDQEADAHGR